MFSFALNFRINHKSCTIKFIFLSLNEIKTKKLKYYLEVSQILPINSPIYLHHKFKLFARTCSVICYLANTDYKISKVHIIM